MEGAGFFPGHFDLSGNERGVVGTEGDDDTLGLAVFGFGVGVEPAGAAERFDAGEMDHLAAFAAEARFEEFVAPVGLAEGGAGAGDGGVGGYGLDGGGERGRKSRSLTPVRKRRDGVRHDNGARRRGVGGGGAEVVEGFDVGGGDGFDGEGAGDASAGVVDERLVIEGFFAGRFVVGDGFEGDVGDLFVFEAAADAFVGMGEFVVVEGGAHQALFGESGGDAGSVAGDPAAAPLLGDDGGGAGAASGVEDEVAGIGGHEKASLNDLLGGLNNKYFF